MAKGQKLDSLGKSSRHVRVMQIRQGRLWGLPFSGAAWLRKCVYFYLLHHSRAWLITTARGTSRATTGFNHRQYHVQHFNQGCHHHGCSGIASRLSRDHELLSRKGGGSTFLCMKLDSERWVVIMRLRTTGLYIVSLRVPGLYLCAGNPARRCCSRSTIWRRYL